MTCQPYHHKHPRLTLSLRTRSRTIGTLNSAVALRGHEIRAVLEEQP